MNPYLKQYQQTQVQTASPEAILIMLYDGAIQFLNKSLKAMQEKNIQESHNNNISAQNIITEFMNTLDIEIGGDVAKNLYSLYEYLHFRLVQANIHKNPAMIEEVLHHLKELKQTWEEAIKIANKEKYDKRSDSYSDESSDEENDDNDDDEEEEEEEIKHGFVG
ncbi:MAG TPA: flagellar export chaperone FliS [Candidatus Gastranaerophilales bacterium]|nr:flagellar export chaperone FliS [Candidatus Gastranaerophilales bacterium]